MNTNKPNWGLAVQILRKKTKTKQRDIAELCGVGEYQVSRWETGRSPIPKEHIAPISKAIGITQKELRRVAALLSE